MTLIDEPTTEESLHATSPHVENDRIARRVETIPEFFAKRSVFITGATGFFGKVLIEKLLRSCPEVETLYVLIRSKSGKNMQTRMEEIFDESLFSRVKEDQPKFRHKLVSICGDCALPGLGISKTDRETLIKNVSVVFHVAATVRFNEKMKLAVAINVHGTKEVIDLCREIPNLKSLVHVSTAYANCQVDEIDETFIESSISADKLMTLMDIMDEDLIESITPQILGIWPNTYSFTKQVAEDVVYQNHKGIPMAVFRPGIVVGTYLEPTSGWIDNVYGPTGVITGVGAGLLRVLHCDGNTHANNVPVDLSVNALIATAWDVANNRYEEPPIYNYVSSCRNPLTWNQFMEKNVRLGMKTPSIKSVWCYNIVLTRYYLLYRLLTILLHIIPGAIIDLGLVLSGKKPKLIQIYNKIHKYLDVISHFSTRQWKFTDKNVQNLSSKLSKSDADTFGFDIADLDWEDFFKISIPGIRRYLFKDDPKTIPAAIIKQHRFLMAQRIMLTALAGLLLWGSYSIVRFFFR